MEAPPTWLITPSPLRHHCCPEIQRLGMVCICLQVLQLYFYSQLQNRAVALRCTWRWCVKPGVHRLESLCFQKRWCHDTGDSEHGGCLSIAVVSKHFVIHQQNSVLCGKSLVHLLSINISVPQNKWSWMREVWVGIQELRRKQQQNVFEKIIFVHIGEDENSILRRWFSLDILCREIISFGSGWAYITLKCWG